MSNALVKVPRHDESPPNDPYGTKKGYQSWQQTIRRISQMTIPQLQSLYGDVIRDLAKYGNVTLRELVVMRAFYEAIVNPNPSMIAMLMERDEGRVPQTVVSASGSIGDWVEAAKESNIPLDEVMREAEQLIREYNKEPVVVDGEVID